MYASQDMMTPAHSSGRRADRAPRPKALPVSSSGALFALGCMAMVIGAYWVLSSTGAVGDASVLANWLLVR